MTLKELQPQTRLEQNKDISSDTMAVFLNKSISNMKENLYGDAKEYLLINIFILLFLIYQRAVASLLQSMLNNFKNKKLELLKTVIHEKDFVMFDFKWGGINNFDDYNNLCVELDEYLIKFSKKEEPRV